MAAVPSAPAVATLREGIPGAQAGGGRDRPERGGRGLPRTAFTRRGGRHGGGGGERCCQGRGGPGSLLPPGGDRCCGRGSCQAERGGCRYPGDGRGGLLGLG